MNTKTAINNFEMQSLADNVIPSEIELIPSKDMFVGFDGRVFKALDKNSIVNKSNSRLKYIVIDENHKMDYTQGTGQSTEAMGWMHDIYIRDDDSVWALVEWTESGIKKIISKEYKYISPVYEIDASNNIISILRASITNNPNLNLQALNNKNNNDNNKGDVMSKEINEALGLKAEATESEVLLAIAKTKAEINSQKEALQKSKEELNESMSKLEKEKAELSKALNEANEKNKALNDSILEFKKDALTKEAQSVVEKAINDGKIAPSTKETYTALCMEEGGIDKFNKIMENTPSASIFKEYNNLGKKDDGKKALNETDKQMAKAMGYSEEEYKAIQEKGA